MKPWKRLAALGAAAILIGFITTIFIDKNKFQKQQQLITAFYEKPVFDGINRSVELEKFNELDKARYYLETNHFDKSEEILNNLLSEGTPFNSSSVHDLLGHVYFNQNLFEKAEEQFLLSGANTENCTLLLCQVLLEKATQNELKDKCSPQ